MDYQVMLRACLAAECLSEAGAYYGSDFPAAVHTGNASSPEACCRICQSTPDCSVWNWCGSPFNLAPLLCRAHDAHCAPSLSCVLMPGSNPCCIVALMLQTATALDEVSIPSPQQQPMTGLMESR